MNFCWQENMKQVTDFIILNKKKQKIQHKLWWSMSPQDGAQWEATAFIWECVCVFASVSMCVFACFNGYLSLSCVYVCDCVYLCVISHGMSLCVFVVFVCFCLCVYDGLSCQSWCQVLFSENNMTTENKTSLSHRWFLGKINFICTLILSPTAIS